MIDEQGYRSNVGIILMHPKLKQVFWAKRIGQHGWQFPQGGANNNESLLATLYRELNEEVGLLPQDVRLIATTRSWMRYRLPESLIRSTEPRCIGQKQKWFLLELTASEAKINLKVSQHPEFETWRWVNYWYPVKHVIPFKKTVYRKALEHFSPYLKRR